MANQNTTPPPKPALSAQLKQQTSANRYALIRRSTTARILEQIRYR